jgi:hypothetical protein
MIIRYQGDNCTLCGLTVTPDSNGYMTAFSEGDVNYLKCTVCGHETVVCGDGRLR